MTKVNTSSRVGEIRPAIVTAARPAVTMTRLDWTAIKRRLRSSVSASTPPTIPKSASGSVSAVWTSDTRMAAWAAWTKSHWAPTVCIQAPTLLTRDASHNHRKTATRSGAHVDEVACRSGITRPRLDRELHPPTHNRALLVLPAPWREHDWERIDAAGE